MGSVQIELGHHTFSESDMRKTLYAAPQLLGLGPAAGTHERIARLERVARSLDGIDPMRADADALRPLLATVWRELTTARDELAASGLRPARAEGVVPQLGRSDGGVAKLPVDRVDVGFAGVVGDSQAARVHHGRPWQALCLWSAEVIAALTAGGHPIAPGNAGENVTIRGIDWERMYPGVRLQLGSVLCEVSAYAVPCTKNARWFADLDFTQIHHSNGPISRVYATVITPGAVAVGDAAVLEP